MIGRIFATVARIEDKDVIQDVQIAFWSDDSPYQERHAVLLEMRGTDRISLWEALESVVERDARFAWTREYPGIKEILERRRRDRPAEFFLAFGS